MKKGIDISSFQGYPDFNKVKKAGIDFVIINAGMGRYASQKSIYFDRNYAAARAAGLLVGAYWYSYATDAADAVKEAKACIEAIGKTKFDLPIFYDVEEQSQLVKGGGFLDAIVTAFCDTMAKSGYKAGLYMSLSPLNTMSSTVRNRYPLWVAQYYNRCQYDGKYAIWQHSDSGKVDGIDKKVDMNQLIDESIITKPTPTPTKKKKSVDELAREVIAGKWGNGDTRKQRLTAAGYNYATVQDKVNEMMQKKKSNKEIAKEVIDGKWGNGKDRKVRLTAAGYNYDDVQKIVNQMMK